MPEDVRSMEGLGAAAAYDAFGIAIGVELDFNRTSLGCAGLKVPQGARGSNGLTEAIDHLSPWCTELQGLAHRCVAVAG